MISHFVLLIRMRGNGSSGFPTRCYTNSSLYSPTEESENLEILVTLGVEELELYYPGDDQLCTADLRLCFHLGKNLVFS